MFICDPCHSKSYDCFHFSGSVGRCESCGKHAACHSCNGSMPKPRKKRKSSKKITVQYKSITVVFTMKDLLELGLVGCANCIEATKGPFSESHPPNKHFADDKGRDGRGPCAACKCPEFKMKLRRGREVITPTRRKDGTPI